VIWRSIADGCCGPSPPGLAILTIRPIVALFLVRGDLSPREFYGIASQNAILVN
jgi:hypothetical protein